MISDSQLHPYATCPGQAFFAQIQRNENKNFLLLYTASGEGTARRHQLTVIQIEIES
jgi:hypothetical protein